MGAAQAIKHMESVNGNGDGLVDFHEFLAWSVLLLYFAWMVLPDSDTVVVARPILPDYYTTHYYEMHVQHVCT